MNLEQLQSAFAADPSSNAYYDLIARYVELGRTVEALVVAKKAVEARPNDAVALRTLGWVLLAQNKVDRALTSLSSCLQLDPGDYEARFLYALGLERQERIDEAIVQFDYVLAAFPAHAGAAEAKARCKAPQDQSTEETREEVVEKTIMMAAADILSSRDMKPRKKKEKQPDTQATALELEAQREAKSDQDARAAEVEERRAKRERIAAIARPASGEMEVVEGELIEAPDIGTMRKKALITAGLAVLVTVILMAIYSSYGAWAAKEKAINDRFKAAEEAFVRHRPAPLAEALSLAESVVAERPEHHLAIGLGAHAAVRLADEFGWVEGWDRAEGLLAKFPQSELSIHQRAALASSLVHAGKPADATAALKVTRNGRTVDIGLFKSLRGKALAAQGMNAEARKAFQDSVSDGADHPQLNYLLSRFEFEAGRPGVAQAYIARLLGAADQARGEAEGKAAEVFKKAVAKAKEAKTEPPTEAKPVPVTAFASIEHGPGLVLRAASWLLRPEALARPAILDLKRALALPTCPQEGLAEFDKNCLFASDRQIAEGLRSVALERMGKHDEAEKARQAAGDAYTGAGWVMLARAGLEQDLGRRPEAKALVDDARKAMPHSALPRLAALRGDNRGQPEASLDDVKTLIKAFPDLKGQVQLIAAEHHGRRGDVDAANAQLDDYAKDNANQAELVLLMRARVLRWAKRYDEAIGAANKALDAAVRAGRMNIGHGALVELMRLELRRGGRGSAKRAYKEIANDNPNHTEALFLSAKILGDREAEKHLKSISPGGRWTIELRRD